MSTIKSSSSFDRGAPGSSGTDSVSRHALRHVPGIQLSSLTVCLCPFRTADASPVGWCLVGCSSYNTKKLEHTKTALAGKRLQKMNGCFKENLTTFIHTCQPEESSREQGRLQRPNGLLHNPEAELHQDWLSPHRCEPNAPPHPGMNQSHIINNALSQHTSAS